MTSSNTVIILSAEMTGKAETVSWGTVTQLFCVGWGAARYQTWGLGGHFEINMLESEMKGWAQPRLQGQLLSKLEQHMGMY